MKIDIFIGIVHN